MKQQEFARRLRVRWAGTRLIMIDMQRYPVTVKGIDLLALHTTRFLV